MQLWTNGWFRSACAELRWTHTPKDLFKSTIDFSADQAERFHEGFEGRTLNAVIWLTNTLLSIPALQAQTSAVACDLGNAEDESIVTDEVVWQPYYVVKFRDAPHRPRGIPRRQTWSSHRSLRDENDLQIR